MCVCRLFEHIVKTSLILWMIAGLILFLYYPLLLDPKMLLRFCRIVILFSQHSRWHFCHGNNFSFLSSEWIIFFFIFFLIFFRVIKEWSWGIHMYLAMVLSRFDSKINTWCNKVEGLTAYVSLFPLIIGNCSELLKDCFSLLFMSTCIRYICYIYFSHGQIYKYIV